MNNLKTDNLSRKSSVFIADGYFMPALFSLAALAATFIVSNLNQTFQTKLLTFLVIIAAYLFWLFWFYIRQRQKNRQRANELYESNHNEEIENRLLALEEAGTFFGASLKFPDMFRLVSSRINELVPFTSCAFFLADENNTNLKIVCAVGENSRNWLNFQTSFHTGLAGKTFVGQKIYCEKPHLSDKNVLPDDILNGLVSGLAVPLFHGDNVFGVLTLYGNDEINFDKNSIELIEAVGTRIAPLFLSSMSFERSLTNALTDTLTNLPNERALFLILENQIAESERNRHERPLTILAVDIKNFTELNQEFGHATGDRILAFAANLIKAQLRQMDFLSRSQNDEFLAVMPTASGKIADEIIERIKKAFVFNEFGVSPKAKINLQLNFGSATFGKNGETAHRLLQYAKLQKQQSKVERNSKVILFPKEYVN